MSLILNIDTASEQAHVGFAKNGIVIDSLSNESQKDHASFLQSAVEQLSKKNNLPLKDIDAVAVSAGPGSYTGLRVGMASAKGLCFALKKPLITLGTLDILTASAMQVFQNKEETYMYCPMIDARRMEVFTAIYQDDFTPVLSPCAMILDEFSFAKQLQSSNILFFGSGSVKWRQICKHAHAHFIDVPVLPEAMAKLSNSQCAGKIFTELAYSEPLYLKEFQIVTPK